MLEDFRGQLLLNPDYYTDIMRSSAIVYMMVITSIRADFSGQQCQRIYDNSIPEPPGEFFLIRFYYFYLFVVLHGCYVIV